LVLHSGPAGPKDRAALQLTDVKSEMSFYFRLRAGYRLPAGKYMGILTQFQTKVKKKTSSMLDSGCLILEKSFTAESAEIKFLPQVSR